MGVTNCKLIEVAPTILNPGASPNVITLYDVITGIAPIAGDVFLRPREYPLPVLSKYFREHNAPFRDPIIIVVPKVGGGVYWLSLDECFPGTQASVNGLQVTGDVFASVLNLSVTEALNFTNFIGTIKNGVITV